MASMQLVLNYSDSIIIRKFGSVGKSNVNLALKKGIKVVFVQKNCFFMCYKHVGTGLLAARVFFFLQKLRLYLQDSGIGKELALHCMTSFDVKSLLSIYK